MSVGAIIVAAGRGSRMGGPTPKQLLDLGGRSVVARAVAAFDSHPRVSSIVVVLPADLVNDGPRLVGATTRACHFVAGGERRQDSVRHGLVALHDDVSIVLIHDAARPFVEAALIDRVIEGVEQFGAALPAMPSRETVKRIDREHRTVRETIDREEIWLAQTPQGFTRSVLRAAMAESARHANATDEAMLAEAAGHVVRIVDGDERNVKITTPEDLSAARARVGSATRVGTGHDLHRLVEGRPLVLAGVVIASDRGPLGHSDGDVVCHALADAMFGGAAMGDIGRHFSNTDPRWKDAPGLDLLQRAAAIVAAGGWHVTGFDVTVILERPKLAPHIDAMRAAIARALALPETAVSVKAKTNEGVDAVGRGEAIAAHAVATLVQST